MTTEPSEDDVSLVLCGQLVALMAEAALLRDLVWSMALGVPLARLPNEQRQMLNQIIDEEREKPWGHI